MPRLSSSKGQWFIIAAVVISGTFLAISTLFQSYFLVDSSEIALRSEDHVYYNIKEQLEKLHEECCDSNNGKCEKKLKYFKMFSQDRMAELGYLVEIDFESVDCSPLTLDYNLSVSTGAMSME